MSFTADTYHRRLLTLQRQVPAGSIWLIANPLDLQYLTGFPYLVPEEREGFLLITRDHTRLLHAHFSPVRSDIPSLELRPQVSVRALIQELNTLRSDFPSLAVDLTKLTAHEYKAIGEAEWSPAPLDPQIVLRQRIVKDEEEIACITRAGQIAFTAYEQFRKELQVGITEAEAARRIEIILLENGSDKVAFPTIVAFGPHGALPHHQPTDLGLENNTPILIDFGATQDGYRSDMSRSWWFGDQPNQEFLEVEHIVQDAYQAALSTLEKTETEAAEVDRAARQIIDRAGFGAHFIHTTGHGVGLDIHEPPSLYQTNSGATLKPGMVITVEPGIYLEGKLGYRYENTLALTTSKPLELTMPSGVK